MKTGEVQVSKTYRKGRVTKPEESAEELIVLKHFIEDKPVASVSAGARMTINLKNYESVQVSVNVTLPCYLEELEDCYETAVNFVEEKMGQQINEVYENRPDLERK